MDARTQETLASTFSWVKIVWILVSVQAVYFVGVRVPIAWGRQQYFGVFFHLFYGGLLAATSYFLYRYQQAAREDYSGAILFLKRYWMIEAAQLVFVVIPSSLVLIAAALAFFWVSLVTLAGPS